MSVRGFLTPEQERAMKYLASTLVFVIARFVTAFAVAANPPDQQVDKSAFVGQPVSLVIQPESIRLAGPRAMRQILVTGRYSASPKAMQRLARHTDIRLTIGRYTHASLLGLVRAVNKLPPLPTSPIKPTSEVQVQRMTGTDRRAIHLNKSPERGARVDKELTISIDSVRHLMSTTDNSSDPIAVSRDPPQLFGDSVSCAQLTTNENKREWMGIEPTWRLFRRHTGFEAQGGHQSREHSRRGGRLFRGVQNCQQCDPGFRKRHRRHTLGSAPSRRVHHDKSRYTAACHQLVSLVEEIAVAWSLANRSVLHTSAGPCREQSR